MIVFCDLALQANEAPPRLEPKLRYQEFQTSIDGFGSSPGYPAIRWSLSLNCIIHGVAGIFHDKAGFFHKDRTRPARKRQFRESTVCIGPYQGPGEPSRQLRVFELGSGDTGFNAPQAGRRCALHIG